MDHSLTLISTLVIAFCMALIFGFIVERFFKTPALVGYLLAGIAAGQHTPGFYADPELAHQLSEIGVMLLMFGVGLHFSFKDLLAVKGIAVPGAVLQMLFATVLGALGAHYCWDRPWEQALVLGLSLSCASTVVLLKALEVRGLLTSGDGRIAVGWLVVEDLATVLILVLLPTVADVFGVGEGAQAVSSTDVWMKIGQTLLSCAAFVAVMMLFGRRLLPWMMNQVAKTGSRELFTLFVLAAALGVAYGASNIFNVGFALGAFFAGMVMQESHYAHRAAQESLPLQDAFAVLFFVGVGMLFDPHILIESPWEVIGVVLIIMGGKSLVAFFLVWALRYPLQTAITVAVSLAQIGEFSFILIRQSAELGLADDRLVNLVVGGAILSIALNPVFFYLSPKLSQYLTSRFAWARKAALREAAFETLPQDTETEVTEGQVVVAGRDPWMLSFAERLMRAGQSLVVVTPNEATAQTLSEKGVSVIVGDMLRDETWVSAHLHNAKQLLLMDSGADAPVFAESARRVADIPIVVIADDVRMWHEVKLDKLFYLSKEDNATQLLATRAHNALRAGRAVGEEIHQEDASPAQTVSDVAEPPSASEATPTSVADGKEGGLKAVLGKAKDFVSATTAKMTHKEKGAVATSTATVASTVTAGDAAEKVAEKAPEKVAEKVAQAPAMRTPETVATTAPADDKATPSGDATSVTSSLVNANEVASATTAPVSVTLEKTPEATSTLTSETTSAWVSEANISAADSSMGCATDNARVVDTPSTADLQTESDVKALHTEAEVAAALQSLEQTQSHVSTTSTEVADVAPKPASH